MPPIIVCVCVCVCQQLILIDFNFLIILCCINSNQYFCYLSSHFIFVLSQRITHTQISFTQFDIFFLEFINGFIFELCVVFALSFRCVFSVT